MEVCPEADEVVQIQDVMIEVKNFIMNYFVELSSIRIIKSSLPSAHCSVLLIAASFVLNFF